jgi:Mrp family chromosome partitioning ATPase/capsular polysaccharide biosynthesis protein
LRYKWLALAGGCLFAGLGAVAGQFGIQAKFKASALVQLNGPSGVVEKPNETSNAKNEFRNTQQELLKMPHVLQRALESPQVKELGVLGSDQDSIEELTDWLQLELPRTSEILRISVQHNRADIAFLLANAVTDAYLAEVRRDDEESMSKRLAVLERLQVTAEDRLTKSWADLRVLARQLGSGDPAALSLQAQTEIENYRDYSRRLRELRSEKREAERLVKSIRESPEMLSTEMPQDTQLSVRYAMFTAMLKKEQALAKWGPNHPDVVAAQQQENLLREYYQKTATEETKAPKSPEEKMLAEPLATIARLENEEQALTTMMTEIDDRVKLLGGDSVAKLEVLRNDITRMERLSDRLWETRENVRVERNADQRVQLVSYASLPTQRDTSKRNKLTLVLAIGGFGFAVFLTAVGEFLTGRLHSAREATQRTGLEVLVALPRLPKKVVNQAPKNPAGRDRVETQLDMLVARLTHHPQACAPRTILVTSARWLRERERLAVHLAAALARTGQRTVLVNFDLRDPQPPLEFPHSTSIVSAEMGSPPSDSHSAIADAARNAAESSGDAEFAGDDDSIRSRLTVGGDVLGVATGRGGGGPVRHQFPAEMPLVGTGIANLDFLQPIRGAAEPLPVLAHPQLPELVEALKQRYIFVVIEVSGVLEYPDAVHLGRLADVSLLSMLRNTSVARNVVQAQGTLAQHGRPVFGTMID